LHVESASVYIDLCRKGTTVAQCAAGFLDAISRLRRQRGAHFLLVPRLGSIAAEYISGDGHFDDRRLQVGLMARTNAKIVAIVALLLASQTANAKMTTVELLAEHCAIAVKMKRSKQWVHPNDPVGDSTAYGHCFGFLEAARQAAPTPMRSVLGGACFTSETTTLDLAEMFIEFAYEHHGDANLPAIGEVFWAFETKYPRKKPTGTVPDPGQQ
jgi:hypothetical protein